MNEHRSPDNSVPQDTATSDWPEGGFGLPPIRDPWASVIDPNSHTVLETLAFEWAGRWGATRSAVYDALRKRLQAAVDPRLSKKSRKLVWELQDVMNALFLEGYQAAMLFGLRLGMRVPEWADQSLEDMVNQAAVDAGIKTPEDADEMARGWITLGMKRDLAGLLPDWRLEDVHYAAGGSPSSPGEGPTTSPEPPPKPPWEG